METTTDPTQVHTEETTGQLSTYESYQKYRRTKCADEFTAAESMYLKLDDRDELRRTKLLYDCRKLAWFVREVSTGYVHVASNSCRLRWCPMCSRAKSMYITHNVKPWIESLRAARFLTLTLKHSNAPLLTQIDKLYADFRSLRKCTQFKKLCQGGVWFFQIKLMPETQQWHPHLHCILAGKYIAKEWLSAIWHKTTHSSKIIDIRMIRQPEKAANEVARYSASPAELKELDSDQRVEVFDAMHGRRMCGTWGIAKQVSLSPPRSVDSSKYEDLGSYCFVVGMADTDETARKIFLSWRNHEPLPASVNIRHIDRWIEGQCANLQAEVDAGKYDPVFDYQ